MVDDLKIIRKKYGENMSKLCRELFPTLLESNGLLSNLMLSNFSDNHFLYDDLKDYDLILDFKNYIFYYQNTMKRSSKYNKTSQRVLYRWKKDTEDYIEFLLE